MKTIRKTALLALALIVCFTAFAPAYAANTAGKYGTVTADDVNFRAEPSIEAQLIDKLPKMTVVSVLSYEKNWYNVVYNGKSGYIRQDMLFVASSTARAAYIREDNTAMKGGPDQNAYTVTRLNTGDPIRVKNLLGEWYYCSTGSDSGYIHMDSVSVARPGTSSLDRMLNVGMEGAEVQKLQTELYERGFLSVLDTTGYYGNRTKSAVRAFQKACGLEADGIAGDATLAILYDESNTVTADNAMYNQVRGTVELLDWFEGGSSWLAKGAYFVVTDVRTGLSFNARRFGGWFHADSEPVTADDSAIVRSLAGGWSWDRRPVWITYNGRTVAASIHTMPHMANPTRSNNFDGHFCVHLLHSKVHANGKECPRHQACVREAYEKGRTRD